MFSNHTLLIRQLVTDEEAFTLVAPVSSINRSHTLGFPRHKFICSITCWNFSNESWGSGWVRERLDLFGGYAESLLVSSATQIQLPMIDHQSRGSGLWDPEIASHVGRTLTSYDPLGNPANPQGFFRVSAERTIFERESHQW